VYGDGVSQHQVVEIAEFVAYHPVFELYFDLLFLKANTDDPADVAVKNIFLIVPVGMGSL
jgi:hypothetical protein